MQNKQNKINRTIPNVKPVKMRILRAKLFFSLFVFIRWRLIILQYCSGFCHILTNQPWIYMCSPSWIPLPPLSPRETSLRSWHPNWDMYDNKHPELWGTRRKIIQRKVPSVKISRWEGRLIWLNLVRIFRGSSKMLSPGYLWHDRTR